MNDRLQIIPVISAVLFSLLVSCSYFKKDSVRKDSAFDARSAFHQVEEKMNKRKYADARDILSEIKAKDTSGEYAILAQIRVGDTYYKEGMYEEAAVEYQRFLDLHSYHKYASYAQYQLAMTHYKRIKTVDISYGFVKNALAEFEKLLKIYPRNPYVDIVENRIRSCKNMLAEYEYYVAQFYYKKGSYSAAAGRFEDMIRNFPDAEKEPDALYFLGVAYRKIGEHDKSLLAFTRLIEKYPATRYSREAREMIASFKEKSP